MGARFVAALLHLLLVSQCFCGSRSREVMGGQMMSDGDETRVIEGEHQKKNQVYVHHAHPSSGGNSMNHMDPALNVFFTINDLKAGKEMPVYFAIKDPSKSPRLLPKEEADSIPFSSAELPFLLSYFSFSEESQQAKAMKDTLRHCEHEPLKGEIKFCATSLESMLDSVRGIFRPSTKLKVLTTNHLTKPRVSLQKYSVSERPSEILAHRIVACHSLPYPYAVFYCHSQDSDHKLLMVSLVGEDGGRVEAPAMCHMDTSQWDPNHLAFMVLRTKPGNSSVCHFFPEDNLIWIPSSSAQHC